MLKKAIVSTIAALSIGFSSNLLSSQTGTQVSPSVINLSAAGVSEVTIHTSVEYGDCSATVMLVDADSNEFTFPNDELSLSDDSLGHLVMRIETWDAFRATEVIAVGEAAFSIDGTCNGEPFEGMDEVLVTVNAANMKGNTR